MMSPSGDTFAAAVVSYLGLHLSSHGATYLEADAAELEAPQAMFPCISSALS